MGDDKPATIVQPPHSDPDPEWAEAVRRVLAEWLRPEIAIAVQPASLSLPIPESEKKLVARAVVQRRAEFTAGRWCAHRALEQIGMPAREILIGPYGGPCWPAEVSGSIVHESGICAALAVRKSLVPVLGLDLVDTTRKIEMEELAHLFLTSEDKIDLPGLDERMRTIICFCVKEAVIKGASAHVNRFLDFNEIRVEISPGRFQGRLEAMPEIFSGRWTRVGPFVLSAHPAH